MQRASAAFGLLIFVLWLIVLAVGLAYVTVWATTQRRPQWRFLGWLTGKPMYSPAPARGSAQVIPFESLLAKRDKRS
jgi:hypothetical protein